LRLFGREELVRVAVLVVLQSCLHVPAYEGPMIPVIAAGLRARSGQEWRS
jgi:hypothetical protein